MRRQQVPHAEENFTSLSVWFRKGDKLLLLRCSREMLYELNVDLHLLFIDFKQASDSVHLYEILKEFRIPKKIVNLIKM